MCFKFYLFVRIIDEKKCCAFGQFAYSLILFTQILALGITNSIYYNIEYEWLLILFAISNPTQSTGNTHGIRSDLPEKTYLKRRRKHTTTIPPLRGMILPSLRQLLAYIHIYKCWPRSSLNTNSLVQSKRVLLLSQRRGGCPNISIVMPLCSI